ncbi:hypothetical protein Taro_012284 [Colocasia esculenta]|uniref:C2H2-type domain-containing protein n=1 Tax=Colocasia esculenta TaxID=4460 RepID=A0A843U3L8_COLES|nr:hypothetical protein [Colocasia esculenta]
MVQEWDEQGDFHPYCGRTGAGVGTAVAREQHPGSGCRTMGGDPLQPPPHFDRVRAAASEAIGRGGAGPGSASTRTRVRGWSRVSEKRAPEEQKEGTAGVTGPAEAEEEDEEEEEEEEEHEGPKPEGETQRTAKEDGSTRGNDPITTCSLCGKSFPSRKSLYGHMRCHPEREWRGIKPPPGTRMRAPPSSSSPSRLSVVPFLTGSASDPQWPGWSITQKRGRKGTKHHSPVRSSYFMDNHDDPMVAAVSSLLHITEGGFKHGPQVAMEEMIPEEEAVSSDGLSSEPADANPEPEKPAICEVVKQPAEAANGDSEEYDLDVLAENKSSKRKIRGLETLHDELRAAGRNRRYRCNTCNKCFPSHQALGGHRASHKKEKSAPEEETAGDDAEPAAAPPPLNTEPLSSAPNLVVHKASVLAEHRCDKCSMVFPTGQALGGHKRKHWNGHESSVAAAPAKGNVELSALRDFDLNKRPQDGLEEEF